MKNKFRNECQKFYNKHWKSHHFMYDKEIYLEKIVPFAREIKTYKYVLRAFSGYKTKL